MAWEPKDPWGQQGGADPLDDVLKKAKEQWQRMKPTRGMKSIILIVAGILVLSQAVFKVEPDEEGLVKRFGDVVRTVGPGPHLKLPFLKPSSRRRLKNSTVSKSGFAPMPVDGLKSSRRKPSC